MSVFVLQVSEAPAVCIQRFLLQRLQTHCTLSWLYGLEGWKLSAEAVKYPTEFKAIIFVAVNYLHIPRCVGARLGRGLHILGGMHNMCSSYLLWWPASQPEAYKLFSHNASETVHLHSLFKSAAQIDYCWVQFFTVDTGHARIVRRITPEPLVAHDPRDPYIPDHPMPVRTLGHHKHANTNTTQKPVNTA